MSERYRTKSAVMLLFFRDGEAGREILLQRRQNTGYGDGMWDCAVTGHVDPGESMKMAAVREAAEELGVEIAVSQLDFATMTHIYTPSTGDTYYNAYFLVSGYRGTPSIREPRKCVELAWLRVDDLPGDLIPDRREAIRNALKHIPYSESGWGK